MKKVLFCLLTLFATTNIFSQELIVVVAPFDIRDGFSVNEAETITYLFMDELSKYKGTVKVVDQTQATFNEIIKRMNFELSDWSNDGKVAEFGKALNANAVVLGRMMMLVDQRIITARILDVQTTQILSTSRMDIMEVNEVLGKLPAFTKEIVERLKPPSPPPPVSNTKPKPPKPPRTPRTPKDPDFGKKLGYGFLNPIFGLGSYLQGDNLSGVLLTIGYVVSGTLVIVECAAFDYFAEGAGVCGTIGLGIAAPCLVWGFIQPFASPNRKYTQVFDGLQLGIVPTSGGVNVNIGYSLSY